MESWTCCLSEVTFSCPLEERGFLGQTGCLLNDAEYFFPKPTVAVGNRSELVTARRSVYLFNILTYLQFFHMGGSLSLSFPLRCG